MTEPNAVDEYIKLNMLKEHMSLLVIMQNKLSHADYVEIWGEELGDHIWRQDGSNLLKIWNSGLTAVESDKLVRYILKKGSRLK